MAKINWRDLTDEQITTLKSNGVNHGNYNEFLSALKEHPEFFSGATQTQVQPQVQPQRYTAEQNKEMLATAREDGTYYPGFLADIHKGTPGANAPVASVPDNGQLFFNEVLRQSYTGDVSLDQLLAIDQSTLTRGQRTALQPTIRALQGYDSVINGKGKLTDQDMGEFMRGMHNLEMNSPESFQLLMSSNPELAIKYLASMGTARYFVEDDTVDPRDYRNRAESLGYQMGVDAGFGEDGKQDGRAYVSGYGTQWADVNNEGGRGDFRKLGTPSKIGDGVLNWVEDNPLQVAGMIALSVLATPASSALVNAGYTTTQAAIIVSAGSSAVTTALQGGDVTDILKSAATAGATAGVMEYVPGFGDVYGAQNVAGSFVRGTTNDAINQLAYEGNVDLKDAATSGLINVGVEGVFDIFGDAKQTNDENLIEGVDTVNGAEITSANIDRLTNTTDAYGILGENGLLNQVGIDLSDVPMFTSDGYLKTDWIGDALDAVDSVTGLDLGGRPVVDPGGKIADATREELDAIGDLTVTDPVTGEVRPATFQEKADAIDSVLNQYYTDTARYDERYFDITSERGDVPMSGIWEENPYAIGNTSTISVSGDGSIPGAGSSSYTIDGDNKSDNSDSVNWGGAEYADISDSTIPVSSFEDDGRELVLGSELPDGWLPNEDTLPVEDRLPPADGRDGWIPDFTFTGEDIIPDTDNEDIIPFGDPGYGLELGDPSFGGNFEPEWSELFPYTKLTPLQKKALRPYASLIAAMRQGGVA